MPLLRWKRLSLLILRFLRKIKYRLVNLSKLDIEEITPDPSPCSHIIEIKSDYYSARIKIDRDRAVVLIHNLPLPQRQRHLNQALKNLELRTHACNRTQIIIVHHTGEDRTALHEDVLLKQSPNRLHEPSPNLRRSRDRWLDRDESIPY